MNSESSPEESVSVRKPLFDWTDRDQKVLLGLALMVMAAIGVSYLKWRWHGESLVEIERLAERQYDFRVDINHASWIEWMQLDGIGEVLARRIVADRKDHGPFASIDRKSVV